MFVSDQYQIIKLANLVKKKGLTIYSYLVLEKSLFPAMENPVEGNRNTPSTSSLEHETVEGNRVRKVPPGNLMHRLHKLNRESLTLSHTFSLRI